MLLNRPYYQACSNKILKLVLAIVIDINVQVCNFFYISTALDDEAISDVAVQYQTLCLLKVQIGILNFLESRPGVDTAFYVCAFETLQCIKHFGSGEISTYPCNAGTFSMIL